jgi:hypothetical protein
LEPGWTLRQFHPIWQSFVIPAGACGYPPATYLPGPNENDYWGAGPELKRRGIFGELAAAEDLDNYNNDFGSFYQRSFAAGELEPGTTRYITETVVPMWARFNSRFRLVRRLNDESKRIESRADGQGSDAYVGSWRRGMTAMSPSTARS